MCEINLLDIEEEIECDCGCPLEDFDIDYISFNKNLTIPPEIEDRYDLPEDIYSITYLCPDCGNKIIVNNDYE